MANFEEGEEKEDGVDAADEGEGTEKIKEQKAVEMRERDRALLVIEEDGK